MTQKNEQSLNLTAEAFCSPPSHPTTLGNVWVGETRPSEAALAEVLKMAATSEKSWDK
jgi:hypothetical protein